MLLKSVSNVLFCVVGSVRVFLAISVERSVVQLLDVAFR